MAMRKGKTLNKVFDRLRVSFNVPVQPALSDVCADQ